MNRRTLALLLITACALPALTIAQERNAPGHGTLGILIITKEGMVLAADSRTTYSNSHYDDHAVKIFKLGEHSACMIAGWVFQPPSQKAFGFNLPRQIETISGNPSLLDDVGTYTFQIQNDLASAIDRGSIKVPATDFFEDDPEIASVMVAGYSLRKGGPPSNIPDRYMAEASKIEYLSRPTPDIGGKGMFHRIYSVPVRNYQVLEVGGPGPFAIITNGNDDLLKAMLAGKPRRTIITMKRAIREVDLKELSDDPAMRMYLDLRDRGQLDTMSLEQAVDLAFVLIRANISLAGDDLAIGGHVNIATITRQQGFQWVPGQDPAASAGR